MGPPITRAQHRQATKVRLAKPPEPEIKAPLPLLLPRPLPFRLLLPKVVAGAAVTSNGWGGGGMGGPHENNQSTKARNGASLIVSGIIVALSANGIRVATSAVSRLGSVADSEGSWRFSTVASCQLLDLQPRSHRSPKIYGTCSMSLLGKNIR